MKRFSYHFINNIEIFPNNLGGISFEKLVNYLGEGTPLFFESLVFLPLKPQPFLENDLGFHPKNPTRYSIYSFNKMQIS